MKTRVQLDSQGIGNFLRSPGLQSAISSIGGDALREAERRAPRGPTGDYASRFRMEEGLIKVTTRYGTGLRAGARIINDSKHAAAVEWRWGHHTLGSLAGRTRTGKGHRR